MNHNGFKIVYSFGTNVAKFTLDSAKEIRHTKKSEAAKEVHRAKEKNKGNLLFNYEFLGELREQSPIFMLMVSQVNNNQTEVPPNVAKELDLAKEKYKNNLLTQSEFHG